MPSPLHACTLLTDEIGAHPARGRYGELAVHVLLVKAEGATQLGSKEGHELAMQTEYVDTETAKGSFDAQPGATYFIVISTKEPKQTGDFSITTVGIGTCSRLTARPPFPVHESAQCPLSARHCLHCRRLHARPSEPARAGRDHVRDEGAEVRRAARAACEGRWSRCGTTSDRTSGRYHVLMRRC
jgi:hypothetical protein